MPSRFGTLYPTYAGGEIGTEQTTVASFARQIWPVPLPAASGRFSDYASVYSRYSSGLQATSSNSMLLERLLVTINALVKVDVPRLLASKLGPKVENCTQNRDSGLLSWLCALVLIFGAFVQATHACPLRLDIRTELAHSIRVGDAGATEAFCAICATSHSPSLLAVSASFEPSATPPEPVLVKLASRTAKSQTLVESIRPPPIF